MREIIGVESWISVLGVNHFIKKDALFFDKIVIPHLSYFLHIIETVKTQEPQVFAKYKERFSIDECLQEIHWLLDNGFIFETSQQFDNQLLSKNPEFQHNFFEFGKYIFQIKDLAEGESKKSIEKMIKHFLKGDFDIIYDIKLKEIFGNFYQLIETTNRLFAIQLRELENLEAYPILLKDIKVSAELEANKTDVVQITLNNFPIPSETASWEQINDFRKDADSIQKFLDLRNWINEIARAKISPIEIEQKLEFLLAQYQRQLKLHNLKTNSGTFEVVSVSSAEFIEDLTKLKFGKIVKSLFSIKHRKIELMEKEMSAEGREIAYIIKAQNKFSNP